MLDIDRKILTIDKAICRHLTEADYSNRGELCPKKWTFGHTKTDTYRFKEQFHRFETVMPETRYVDDVSH